MWPDPAEDGDVEWAEPVAPEPVVDDDLPDPGPTFPAPEVRARPATEGEIPRTAASLARAATDAGWAVRLTYARGTAPDRRGRPTRVVESLILRARRGPLRLVGTWWDGRFRTGWLLVPGAGPVPLGARALAKAVRS